MVRVRRAFVPDWSLNRVGVWLTFSSILAIPAFNNGQLNVLIAAGTMLAVAAGADRRWIEAALWAALIAAIKGYPIAVGMLLLLAIPKRFAFAFVAATLVLFALPFLLQDPDYVIRCYEDFVRYSALDSRIYADISRVPRDWTTLPRMYLGIVPTSNVQHAVAGVAAAVFAGITLRLRRSPEVLPLVWGLASVWMTVFGPATEMNTYSIAAAFAPFVALRAVGRLAGIAAWCGVALLTATVLRGMFPNDRNFNVYGPQAVGMLLLLPATLGFIRKDPRLAAKRDFGVG